MLEEDVPAEEFVLCESAIVAVDQDNRGIADILDFLARVGQWMRVI